MSNCNKLVKIAAKFEGQNIWWKTIIHTCEDGSLRIDGRVSQKKKRCSAEIGRFCWVCWVAKINHSCKAKLRNCWSEEYNSKTRGKGEHKLIESSPCCRSVLVEHWQNVVCWRRELEIEWWNLTNDCRKYNWRAFTVYCSHGHTDGLVQTFAVVIGDGQDNGSGPGASSKIFHLIFLDTFPIDLSLSLLDYHDNRKGNAEFLWES